MHNIILLPHFIKGQAVSLRHWQVDDLDDFFEYASNQANMYWMRDYALLNLNEAQAYMHTKYLQSPLGKYAIILNATNKLIGYIEIRSSLDFNNQQFYDIGYILNAKFAKQGHMSQALNLLINMIFTKTKISQIILEVDAENQASNHLANKFADQVYLHDFTLFNQKLRKTCSYHAYIINRK